jgi:rhodanese-related sulfurtransferase
MQIEVPFEISCEELRDLQAAGEAFHLVDCRGEDEFAICKIEGAKLVPLQTIPVSIPQRISEKTDRVVVYCHHGMRSARATEYLRSLGYAKAQSLAGGIDQWSARIDPSVPRY